MLAEWTDQHTIEKIVFELPSNLAVNCMLDIIWHIKVNFLLIIARVCACVRACMRVCVCVCVCVCVRERESYVYRLIYMS